MNVNDALSHITQYFHPRIIGEVNDQYIKVAKIKGEEIPWHNHEMEDELFFILEGTLKMEIENQPDFMMKKGDFYVVKKGVNHRVSATDECSIMLIESKTTEHTGKVIAPVTKSIADQQY